MTRIVFPEPHWRDMVARFESTTLETAAYALIGENQHTDGDELLVRDVIHLEDKEYAERLPFHLLIEPRSIRRIIRMCEQTGLGVLAIHSHPMQHADVDFSPSDDFGEERELRVFNDFGSGKWPLASMVWAPGGVRARTWHYARGRATCSAIHELVIPGRTYRRLPTAGGIPSVQPDPTHDRQVRIFGTEGQQRLHGLHVGVVGAGGTGSAVSEMLTRLGVGALTLMDPDILEVSNVSRVYGSTPADVGRAKVDVLAAWLRRISPRTKVTALAADARSHLRALRAIDFLFVCTDNDSSRAALNQFAHQYLKPMIELGNRIESDGTTIMDAAARLTYTFPGAPCLECFGSINHDRVRDEVRPRSERDRLKREGYIKGSDAPEPSVITLNTLISSLACTKFLSIVNNIGGTESQRYTYSYLDSTLRAVGATMRDPCICTHYRGYGDLKPLPTLVPLGE